MRLKSARHPGDTRRLFPDFASAHPGYGQALFAALAIVGAGLKPAPTCPAFPAGTAARAAG
jgi:hypothetical protein